MRLLTYGQSDEWLASQAMPLIDDVIAYGKCPWPSATFGVPSDSGAKTALARALVPPAERATPLLLAVTEWDVWPSSGNEYLFKRVRDPLGSGLPFEDAPGHLLTPEEEPLSESLLALTLYFVWSVALFDPARRLVVVTDDDEGIRWLFEREEDRAGVLELAEGFGLKQWHSRPG